MQSKKFNLPFTSFILKIIAIVTMTIDHIGVEFLTGKIYTVSRIIGRLSFPIFVFLLFEGLRHTSNIKKYLFRLGLFAGIIYLGITIGQLAKVIDFGLDGNIFATLFFLALLYYFATSKNKYLVLIPLLYFAGSIAFNILVNTKIISNRSTLFYCVNGLYAQYEIIAILLFGLTLLMYFLLERKTKYSLSAKEYYKICNTQSYQTKINLCYFVALNIVSLIFLWFNKNPIGYSNFFFNLGEQFFMIFAAFIILLYNGKPGPRNKFLQWGFYLYYPLHLLILGALSLFI